MPRCEFRPSASAAVPDPLRLWNCTEPDASSSHHLRRRRSNIALLLEVQRVGVHSGRILMCLRRLFGRMRLQGRRPRVSHISVQYAQRTTISFQVRIVIKAEAASAATVMHHYVPVLELHHELLRHPVGFSIVLYSSLRLFLFEPTPHAASHKVAHCARNHMVFRCARHSAQNDCKRSRAFSVLSQHALLHQ